jgi:signal transduction histidine kinase/ActR/RegA family two-component response regulator
MPYRPPQDLALDAALRALLDVQVQEGHYSSPEDAAKAAMRVLRGRPGQARDVLAEEAGETALYDSMDFARLALSAVQGVGVWTYEVAKDRFYCDSGISELYGIDSQEAAAGIKRHDFLANVHPDDLAGLRATMANGLVESGDLELEYRIVHPDGTVRWVLSRGHTYFSSTGTPVRRTGVGIEMTAQRLLEQQLRQSQKMEAVGQLTGGLAHDFNNMLAGVMGSLDMLRLRSNQGRFDAMDRYLDTAQGACRRAAALTHRLLAFSRRQMLTPTPTDISGLVEGMLDLIRSTLGPAVHVKVEHEPTSWLTLIDANQLESALLNLCINARDAMPSGGTLTLRTQACAPDAHLAAGQDLSPGEYLSLSVTDTGTGMSRDVMAHAFDPFFTTKPTGEGTGLGLSMIYGFVRQSGGNVTIGSTPGVGTTMTLLLPRSRTLATAFEQTGSPSCLAAATGGETVLVITDDPSVRLLVADILEEVGYTVLQAADGKEGLAVLASTQRLDLLITDVGLPGSLNGRQLADAGRALRPDLNVLFVTGYAQADSAWKGALQPGMHVLTKPFSMDELTRRIKRLISESGRRAPNSA